MACGNIVEVTHTGAGELFCCGAAMGLMKENTVDAAKEKHVPEIAETDDGFVVTVGSVEHPMEEDHYIEWIELVADDKVYREYLKAGDKPSATFCVKAEKISARAYCNLHGLWSA